MSQTALFPEDETYARKHFELINPKHEELLTYLHSFVKKKIKFLSIEMEFTSLPVALMFLRSILCLRSSSQNGRLAGKTCLSLFSFKKLGCSAGKKLLRTNRAKVKHEDVLCNEGSGLRQNL